MLRRIFASIYQIYVGHSYGEYSPVSGCGVENSRLARMRHKRKLGKLGSKSLSHPPRRLRYDTKSVLKSMNAKKGFCEHFQDT
jgi:hypothetical protein